MESTNQPAAMPQTPPQAAPQMQQTATKEDERAYCGFLRDPFSGTVIVDKINAPSLKWTRAGAFIIAALTFFGILLAQASLFLTAIFGLASVGVMILMLKRLTDAMSAKGMWYPKTLLTVTAIVYTLSVIVGDIEAVAESIVLYMLAFLLSAAAAVCFMLTGKQFKSLYCGNLGRFGNAMFVIGIIMAIGAAISLYEGPTSSSDSYWLRHADSIFMVLFALPYCIIYYFLLWPLRILAKMMTDYDEPTVEQYPEIGGATAETNDDDMIMEEESSSSKWTWTVVTVVILIIIRIIIKLNR